MGCRVQIENTWPMWLALGMDALGFLPQIVIDPGSPTRPPPLFPIRLID
jgi:hypothetical protein